MTKMKKYVEYDAKCKNKQYNFFFGKKEKEMILQRRNKVYYKRFLISIAYGNLTGVQGDSLSAQPTGGCHDSYN